MKSERNKLIIKRISKIDTTKLNHQTEQYREELNKHISKLIEDKTIDEINNNLTQAILKAGKK